MPRTPVTSDTTIVDLSGESQLTEVRVPQTVTSQFIAEFLSMITSTPSAKTGYALA